jgi:hypothetical protein
MQVLLVKHHYCTCSWFSARNDSGNTFCTRIVPLVVSTSRSFPHWRLITGFVTRLTRRVPLVEKELPTLPERSGSAYDKWNNPWSFVTQIFHYGQPSHGGDRNTFEVMTSMLPKRTLGSVASLLSATLYHRSTCLHPRFSVGSVLLDLWFYMYDL